MFLIPGTVHFTVTMWRVVDLAYSKIHGHDEVLFFYLHFCFSACKQNQLFSGCDHTKRHFSFSVLLDIYAQGSILQLIYFLINRRHGTKHYFNWNFYIISTCLALEQNCKGIFLDVFGGRLQMREICIIWYLYNVVIKAEIRLVFAILFMTFVRFLVLRNMYYCATAYNMK